MLMLTLAELKGRLVPWDIVHFPPITFAVCDAYSTITTSHVSSYAVNQSTHLMMMSLESPFIDEMPTR